MHVRRNIFPVILILVFSGLMISGLACSSTSTATPVAPTATAMSAPSPTAVPQPTNTPIPTVAPTATSSAAQPQYGGTLTYAVNLEIGSFDPVYMQQDLEAPAAYLLYDRLLNLNPDMTLGPELAQSWTVSPDGKAITLHLRQGIKFTDGTPFNADAAKFELDRCLDPAVVCTDSDSMGPIASVDKVDNYTITINLKEPFRPSLGNLSVPEMSMPSQTTVMSDKSYSDAQGTFGKQPVGSGPFEMKVWAPVDHVTFVKNPNYWQSGKPYLDQIIFQNASDPGTALAMVRTGESDFTAVTDTNQLALLKNNPNVKIVPYDSGRIYIIRLLTNKPPFDNKDLRQAVGFAINRQALIDSIYGGAGRPAYSTIGQGWAYDPSVKPIYYDVAMAKQKVASSGYNGAALDFRCSSDTQSVSLCEATKAMLEAVGLNVHIDETDPADFFSGVIKGNYALSDGYRSPEPDPGLLLSEIFQTGGRGNFTGYTNPQVDTLLNQGGATYDIAAATKIYDQVQQITTEDATTIDKMWATTYEAMSTKVQGFVWYPTLDPEFQWLWLSK